MNFKLTQAYFQGDTHYLANELLGQALIRWDGKRLQVGMIVETEVYDGFEDQASHASKSRTPRNEVMFGAGGYYYVYLIYGMYWNLNIITGGKEHPAGILVRALEPLFDSELDLKDISIKEKFRLASGPGRLCRWLNVDKTFYGKSVESDEMFLVEIGCLPQVFKYFGFDDKNLSLDFEKLIEPKNEIMKARRVGVDYAGEWAEKEWRYYIKDNPYVSKK